MRSSGIPAPQALALVTGRLVTRGLDISYASGSVGGHLLPWPLKGHPSPPATRTQGPEYLLILVVSSSEDPVSSELTKNSRVRRSRECKSPQYAHRHAPSSKQSEPDEALQRVCQTDLMLTPHPRQAANHDRSVPIAYASCCHVHHSSALAPSISSQRCPVQRIVYIHR